MKRNMSDIVSNMMRGALILKAISDALQDRGGDDSYLMRVLAQGSSYPGKVADVLMGRNLSIFSSVTLAADLIPESMDKDGVKRKWEIVEDVEPSAFKIKDLELVPFLEDNETTVLGNVMRDRAVRLKANLGLVEAKRMLDNQEEIPKEFRGKYLVFTGTLLRRPDGSLRVACLYWSRDRWCLLFGWVGGGWDDNGRLVRCK